MLLCISCQNKDDQYFSINSNDFVFETAKSNWEINSQKFPGEWKAIAIGYSLDKMDFDTTYRYMFCEDHILMNYDYRTKEYFFNGYYRADSLFYHIDIKDDGAEAISRILKYAFYDDKLLLELVGHYFVSFLVAPPAFELYQRIK